MRCLCAAFLALLFLGGGRALSRCPRFPQKTLSTRFAFRSQLKSESQPLGRAARPRLPFALENTAACQKALPCLRAAGAAPACAARLPPLLPFSCPPLIPLCCPLDRPGCACSLAAGCPQASPWPALPLL